VTAHVLEFAAVSKNFGGLRPLRIQELRVGAADRIALVGFETGAAEAFVNLATGATLPDAGEVKLFDRPTSSITDSAEWLTIVDRLGIVSERAVLLDQMTVVQNLVLPFTLQIEPPPDPERARAEAIACEVGLPRDVWTRPLAHLDAAAAMRVRLGRAIALDPDVLLLEHASASLPRERVASFAADVGALAGERGVAVVAVTADESFARALGARTLTLQPSTGRLAASRLRRW
jgi:predicted ABC-type transport system involved in lysophospholipase L1 biosynthesis ATPase subunit